MILDLFMPGMDGFEICKKIKENPETSHINVLIITGHNTRENKDRAMSAGADDYLVKPVDSRVLQQRVEKFFIDIKKTQTREAKERNG